MTVKKALLAQSTREKTKITSGIGAGEPPIALMSFSTDSARAPLDIEGWEKYSERNDRM